MALFLNWREPGCPFICPAHDTNLPVNVPQSVTPGPGSNVGRFIRECIVYMWELISYWADDYRLINIRLTAQHRGSTDASRRAFWTTTAQRKGKEHFLLGDILGRIKDACYHLIELHESQGVTLPQRHLQRRSQYFLDLVLYALADSRLSTGCGFYFISPNAVQHDPDRIRNFLDFNPSANWMSGMKQLCHHRRFVTNVYASMPHIYPTNVLIRFKLPKHFVELLQNKFGKYFRLPVRTMRDLLVRYARFLAILIWRPQWHEGMRFQWWDFETIFALQQPLNPANPTIPQPQINSCPQFVNNNALNDHNVVSNHNWTWEFNINVPGLMDRDQSDAPEDLECWRDHVETLHKEATKNSQDTQNNHWFSLA